MQKDPLFPGLGYFFYNSNNSKIENRFEKVPHISAFKVFCK